MAYKYSFSRNHAVAQNVLKPFTIFLNAKFNGHLILNESKLVNYQYVNKSDISLKESSDCEKKIALHKKH